MLINIFITQFHNCIGFLANPFPWEIRCTGHVNDLYHRSLCYRFNEQRIPIIILLQSSYSIWLHDLAVNVPIRQHLWSCRRSIFSTDSIFGKSSSRITNGNWMHRYLLKVLNMWKGQKFNIIYLWKVQQSSFYGFASMFPKQYTQAVMTGESKWQKCAWCTPTFRLMWNICRFGWFCGGTNANPNQTSHCQRTRINVLLFVDVGLLHCCQLCISFDHNSVTIRTISHETVCEDCIATWWGPSSGNYNIKSRLDVIKTQMISIL